MRLLELTKGKHAIIDETDFMKAVGKWHISIRGYVERRELKSNGGKLVKLHRMLMDCPANMEVDHINGNKLDNRRENLRVVTHQQNGMNQRVQTRDKSSIFKGVSFLKTGKRIKRWVADIKFNQISKRLGYFTTQVEAAKAYNEKAKELFGQYALLNKI